MHLLHCLPPAKQPEPSPFHGSQPLPFGDEQHLAGHGSAEQEPQLLQCKTEMQQLLGARLEQAQVSAAPEGVGVFELQQAQARCST